MILHTCHLSQPQFQLYSQLHKHAVSMNSSVITYFPYSAASTGFHFPAPLFSSGLSSPYCDLSGVDDRSCAYNEKANKQTTTIGMYTSNIVELDWFRSEILNPSADPISIKMTCWSWDTKGVRERSYIWAWLANYSRLHPFLFSQRTYLMMHRAVTMMPPTEFFPGIAT